MVLATAPADSAETFTVAQRTQCALCDRRVKVAGGGPRPSSTRARCSSAQNRVMGTDSTKPPSLIHSTVLRFRLCFSLIHTVLRFLR